MTRCVLFANLERLSELGVYAHRILTQGGVGYTSTIVTAVMRLQTYVEYYHPSPRSSVQETWYTGITWAIAEHGLSLFATSILALKPVVHLVSSSWTSLASSFSSLHSKRSAGRPTPDAGSVLRGPSWTHTLEETELGSSTTLAVVAVPVVLESEACREGGRLQVPYVGERTGSRESQRALLSRA